MNARPGAEDFGQYGLCRVRRADVGMEAAERVLSNVNEAVFSTRL